MKFSNYLFTKPANPLVSHSDEQDGRTISTYTHRALLGIEQWGTSMHGGHTTKLHYFSSLIIVLMFIIININGTVLLIDHDGVNEEPENDTGSETTPLDIFLSINACSFSENLGQIENSGIHYYSQTGDLGLGFTTSGFIMTLHSDESAGSVVNVRFEGSSAVIPSGEDPMGYRTHHFKGNDRLSWTTGIREYKKIVYTDLYPGIDLVFSQTGEGLKYDWIVEPYADPSVIRESYSGIQSLSLDDDGSLIADTGEQAIRQKAPVTYQLIDSDYRDRITISSSYSIIGGHTIAYDLGSYDPSETLIIDPLIGGTFLGTGDGECIYGVATDCEDNIYVVGTTMVPYFPTTPGAYVHTVSHSEMFITKFDPKLRKLLYSTLIGGWHHEMARAITVDDEGCAYVATTTYSEDFPSTNGSYKEEFEGGAQGVILKLNRDGSDLAFSTFLGTNHSASFTDIVLDENRNVYAAGTNGDIVIVKMSADGTELLAAARYGGNRTDAANGIARDSDGNIFVTGYTQSADFPTSPGCFQATKGGLDQIQAYANDIFVIKLSGNLTELHYSTFIGGNMSDSAQSIGVDHTGCAIVTGSTTSDDFPTSPGCINSIYGTRGDMFVSKLDYNGSSLVYSTYIGSPDNESESAMDLVIDSKGNACVVGHSYSYNFPVTPGCFMPVFPGGGRHDMASAVVVILDPIGSLVYSTYASGGGEDFSEGLAVDSQDNIIVVGWVRLEPCFIPSVPGNYDPVGHNNDGFILKFNTTMLPIPTITIDSSTKYLNTQSIHVTGLVESDSLVQKYVWSVDGIEEYNGTQSTCIISPLPAGDHIVSYKALNEIGWSNDATMTIEVHERPTANIITVSPDPCLDTDEVLLLGHGSDDGSISLYSWIIGDHVLTGPTPNITFTGLSAGETIVHLKVQDNYGVWSEEVSASFHVVTRPESRILPFPQEVLVEDGSMVVSWETPNERMIERAVCLSSIDEEIFNGTDISFILHNLTPGQHQISLRILDEYGFWSNLSIANLTVTERPIPWIDGIIPDVALPWQNIVFHGNGSDDDAVSRYCWNSSLDGILYNGSESCFNFTGLSLGTHLITLTIQDDYGYWSGRISTELIITTPPACWIETRDPDPLPQDEQIVLIGNGTDDGSVTIYRWSSSLDGILYTGNEAMVSIGGLSVGNHTISFMVCDDHGFWSQEDTIILTVHERPCAEIISIAPLVTIIGEEVSFTATGYDDGTITAYQWSSDWDGDLGSTETIIADALSVGTHTISLRVRDDHNCWSHAVSMSLVIMSRPTVVITNVSHEVALMGEYIVLQGYASDEGVITDYSWFSSIDGTLSSEKRFQTNNLSPGDHLITYRARDEHGLWSEDARWRLTIHARPTAEIIQIIPLQPTAHDYITVKGVGIDDGKITKYSWRSGMDGELYDGTWDEAQVGNLSAGNHTIYFRVRDDHGVWSEEVSMSVMVSEEVAESKGDETSSPVACVLFIIMVGVLGFLVLVIRSPEKFLHKKIQKK